MKGAVNSNFEPVIKIGIVFGGKVKYFDAIIDTGFNGFISIPHKLIQRTSWQFIGYEAYELASGEIVKDKVYLGDIVFGKKRKYTYVLSNRTEDILIGTKLFTNKTLVINFRTKKVTVEDGEL
ncbi:MAG: hypothetical protein ABIE84_07260 [bacterium]